MKSYEKAHAWRELFTLAMVQSVDQDAKAAMVERVTGGSFLSLCSTNGG